MDTLEEKMISVGVLTYNHEKYIKEELISLAEQTYPNKELIILDDASIDNTVAIIESMREELEKKFSRVVFIKNQKNCGNIPHNMNVILKNCRGKIF